MRLSKLPLLIAFFLFSGNSLKAQYLDDTMTWTEHYNWLFGGNGSQGYMDYTLSIPDDTLISGLLYHRIERQGIKVDTNMNLVWPYAPVPPVISVISDEVGYLRENGELVYYMPSVLEPEYLLYDFGMGVGDSIGGFEISSVDTIQFGGQQRKRYWTAVLNNASYIIEGVGHTFGGLLYPGVYMYHDWFGLVCAENASMANPYVLDSSFQCDVLSDFTVEYQLPCSVPQDSVHINSGIGSAFVFDGDTSATLFFPDSGLYSALVFDSLSGDSYVIAFHISVTEPETLFITSSSDSLVCPGDSLWLCGEAGHTGYLWSSGSNTECVLFAGEWCGNGSYMLYSVDALGCVHEYYPYDVYCGDSVFADFQWDFSLQEIAFSNNSVNATDFLWDFGDGTSSTDENPYNAYLDGQFEVCLIAQNQCASDTMCQTILVETGIDESDADTEISIRVENTQILICSEPAMIHHVQIFDSSGRQVLSKSAGKHSVSVDVAHLIRGAYFVTGVITSGEVFSKKFIY